MKNEHQEEKVNMKTMVGVLNSSKLAEFTKQFKITNQGLASSDTKKTYQPNQVKVVHFYRFEGESDPADNAILYAIETDTGEKGTIIDAYGMNNDPMVSDFMKQVEEMKK